MYERAQQANKSASAEECVHQGKPQTETRGLKTPAETLTNFHCGEKHSAHILESKVLGAGFRVRDGNILTAKSLLGRAPRC